MPRLLAVCAVLALALPAPADDKPKPNTLTPKEVADGWILLFDGETTFGWKSELLGDGKKGEMTVKNGSLVISTGAKEVVYCSSCMLRHFEASAECRVTGKDAFVGVAQFSGAELSITMGESVAADQKGKWTTVTVRYAPGDKTVVAAVDGKVNPPGFESSFGSAARFGFHAAATRGESQIELRNVKLRPLDTKPLFAGKNLDGWKVNQADPKRVASKFEVTKAGELSVKNGPGDLVTEKEFDNFVLQFECKTLGDGLNSGIFFRCIPGQYQNGYEAQIQNAFIDKDRTKPKDFGTGAVYRRVPARKVVSDDNEWFTMTVVADGRHVSTWVNGYQTVDWTDDRKESENPRQGYRAAKGPVSIQGHDPTTDLLFRNIRIAELPGEKK